MSEVLASDFAGVTLVSATSNRIDRAERQAEQESQDSHAICTPRHLTSGSAGSSRSAARRRSQVPAPRPGALLTWKAQPVRARTRGNRRAARRRAGRCAGGARRRQRLSSLSYPGGSRARHGSRRPYLLGEAL
jgi:hypothetical protein